MKNVTVYRCGTVIADGVKMVDVVHVDPPAAGELARVTFDITGTLTFSPDKYTSACETPGPVHPDTYRVERLKEELKKAYEMSRIGQKEYGIFISALR